MQQRHVALSPHSLPNFTSFYLLAQAWAHTTRKKNNRHHWEHLPLQIPSIHPSYLTPTITSILPQLNASSASHESPLSTIAAQDASAGRSPPSLRETSTCGVIAADPKLCRPSQAEGEVGSIPSRRRRGQIHDRWRGQVSLYRQRGRRGVSLPLTLPHESPLCRSLPETCKAPSVAVLSNLPSSL